MDKSLKLIEISFFKISNKYEFIIKYLFFLKLNKNVPTGKRDQIQDSKFYWINKKLYT